MSAGAGPGPHTGEGAGAGERRSPAGLRAIYGRELRLRGFQEDPAQLAALDELERLRRELTAHVAPPPSTARRLLKRIAGAAHAPVPRGVYLWGGVGRGKTWLMDLFYQNLPFAQRRRSHFHRFMHDVHRQLGQHRRKSDPLAHVAATIAGSVRLLCFDELYVSDIADGMILGKLFGQLHDAGVAMVFTSNVPPSGLYRDGLQRQRFLPAIDLLEESCAVVAVDGAVDYRLRELRQAPGWFPAADANTPGALARLFDRLADGTGVAGGSVDIAGRAVPVVRESENEIWFEFPAICEGARGTDDYIHLAREYQTVIVASVPVFDGTNDNAARRFIALVDELYDRGTKLVLSAAAAPDALYRGQALVFEFRRTASRLVEMQSEDYLAREHRA
jgi:cell division protein ZapE